MTIPQIIFLMYALGGCFYVLSRCIDFIEGESTKWYWAVLLFLCTLALFMSVTINLVVFLYITDNNKLPETKYEQIQEPVYRKTK